MAAIKLQRAQYQAGLADDKLIPQPGLTANTSRLRNLRGDRGSASKYGVELNVQYEVDLWGKLSRQSDAAQWEALATEQDRQSAALSLVGTTATLYWQTGFINQRIATSLESIAAARKTQELVRAQYAAGGASALEVAEAAQTVASQVAAHAVLVQQRVEYVNALAILFDGPPDRTMSDPPRLPQAPLPMARAGVPAELLGRRPDLRAAELRLRQALSNVDAARASFYPSLSLTGTLGGSSDALGMVLQNPVASLAGSLTLPFLQWNQRQLNLKISRTDYEERVVGFRKSLYQAMADVENALSNRSQLRQRGEQLDAALSARARGRAPVRGALSRGLGGLAGLAGCPGAAPDGGNRRDENRLDRLVNQVKVYQALGGDDAPAVDAAIAPASSRRRRRRAASATRVRRRGAGLP